MKNKSDLRLLAKSIRKNLDISSISEQIVSNIRELIFYKKSKHVMIFYPVGSEISLLELLEDNKNFYLPRVKNEELEVCPYQKGDSLCVSSLKINEPICDSVDKQILDIVFIPALMCDNGYCRLGYGGGYYDRFLKNIDAKKFVVIPEELLIENLPVEENDVKCDGYITQKKASF
ncbi:5-formyltetrahydrofolate cyclo-ligase [bacterium]|nr:5-formyltetrahydrofolate cyclo-ligase [bacterium]